MRQCTGQRTHNQHLYIPFQRMQGSPYKRPHAPAGILECELTSWSVAVGDAVEEFQPLCEVTSDKACVEITSRFAGTVEKLHHIAGEMVQVRYPRVIIWRTC